MLDGTNCAVGVAKLFPDLKQGIHAVDFYEHPDDTSLSGNGLGRDDSLGMVAATGYKQDGTEVTTWFPYRYADWLK